MKRIDLREDLEKRSGSRISKLTIYCNSPYYGFADSDLGISFVRLLKRGDLKKDKTGRAKWYFGSDGSLGKAIAEVNRNYRMRVKRKGWEKVRAKVWNLSEADEIIEALQRKEV